MKDNVINVLNGPSPSGMSPAQFRKIDQIFTLAAAKNVLAFRAVDTDFEKGIMTITLAKSENHPAALSFVARKIGPKTTHFELYKEQKGCIEKSALFERVFDRYQLEVHKIIEKAY